MTENTPTQTPAPIEPEATTDDATWLERAFGINNRTRGLMIRKNARLDCVGVIKGDRYHEPGKGLYHASPGYRLHLTKRLRPGQYFLWPETDPYPLGGGGKQEVDVDPITGTRSRDNFAGLLDKMTDGGWMADVARGHKSNTNANPWAKWGTIVLFVAGGGLLLYYAMQQGWI